LKFSVAVRVPPVVGLNVTFAPQLAPAARLDPHVWLKILKSPGFAPASARLLIVIDEVPLFLSTAVFCPPMPPTATDAQLNDVGLTDALPPDVLPPVPERATVCGLPLPVSETVSVAVRVALALGLKAIDTPQLADAARLDPHVLLAITKSPGFAPATETPLMLIVELLPFFNVVVWAPLVDLMLVDPKEREVGLMLTVPLLPPGA